MFSLASWHLIVYNVQETAEEDDNGVEAFFSLMDECMPDGRHCVPNEWSQSQLGAYCPDQNRPRPIRVLFESMNDTHTFLKHAKHLREVSLKSNNDLTTCLLEGCSPKERQEMSADFDTLKSKGHKPFYRGSSLKFRHADRTRTCRRHGATRAPDAKV